MEEDLNEDFDLLKEKKQNDILLYSPFPKGPATILSENGDHCCSIIFLTLGDKTLCPFFSVGKRDGDFTLLYSQIKFND